MNRLAIDFGEKHVGLATSSDTLATPLIHVFQNEALSRILALCQKLQIDEILIGLPEGRLAPKIIEFKTQLIHRTHIPVILWDETLTSAAARKTLQTSHKAQKQKSVQEHALSAALLLQDYLDSLSK
ncbi:MAG: hypothetical protein UV59_C0019G0044 [Candidatus Gottesmanbacteria bacterium GW2011_GWA1_43_11]|uniref:Putative pre-16S rRNA nuclease n=1 Tax=Candidatus Gottesmanbacteria bacterium GW2011_GWA1_43_11 TaxID=1618436 RepID=A0A0G1CG64_9BACT|nr:MAG: hypothetical protein UV59_C0019G0044 [Candidatus Gottesmanbacteria bacterium GW2011_GWA1_43_11]